MPPTPRGSNTKRIMGNRAHLGPGTTAYRVEMQGFNALSEHFIGMAIAGESFFPQILDVTSDIGIEFAKELVPVSDIDEEGHVHTRDTINKSPGVMSKEGRGEWSVRFGPTTYYAPFLEYGTRFMSPRPFMIPAGDLAEKVLFASVNQFLNLFNTNTGGGGFGSGDSVASQALQDPRVRGSVSGVRSLLYSSAKFMGDVSVFGGREIFGPARARMYTFARMLGDTSSIMRGTLDTRISRRMSGRATGKLAGFGVASLSHGSSYSAFPGGEGGRRLYSRSIGRATSIGVSGYSWAGLGN